MEIYTEKTLIVLKIINTFLDPVFGSQDIADYTARQIMMKPTEAEIYFKLVVEKSREISPFRINELTEYLGVAKSQANLLVKFMSARGIVSGDGLKGYSIGE